jgi:pimeloyl-ACP methyl ester carboxylesterase
MANGRVTRAIIANAPHPVLFPKLLYTNRQPREASQYFTEFRDPANDALVREHGLAPLLMKAFEGQVMSRIDEDEAAEMLKDWSDPDAAFGMLNYYRASPMEVLPLDAPYDLPEDYQPYPLPKLTLPTLVIWAMADEALPPANLEGLDEVIADPEVVQVPDCGHFVQWEAPTAFNAAVDAFLDRTG